MEVSDSEMMLISVHLQFQVFLKHGLPLIEELGVANDIVLVNFGIWHSPFEMSNYRGLIQEVSNSLF